jgi:putative membrane protein
VFTGLAIIGFGWRLVSEGHVDLERFGPLQAAVREMDGSSWWLAVLEVAAAAVVFVAMASTVGYVLAFWNFRLTRHDGGTFHVTRGLLTTRATSIEVSRMRGVTISDTLPVRMLGGARAVAIATGLASGRGASSGIRGGTVLLPDAPVAEARRVAAEVSGRPDLVTAPLVGHGSAARRRRFTRALAGAVGVVAVVGLARWATTVGGWAWLAVLLVPALAVPLAADRARNLGHLVRDGFLVTQWGSLTRRRAILDTDAIIGWNVQQSFFQRRAGLATLVATTAAGRQAYRLQDLPVNEVRVVADAALPGLLREFRPGVDEGELSPWPS